MSESFLRYTDQAAAIQKARANGLSTIRIVRALSAWHEKAAIASGLASSAKLSSRAAEGRPRDLTPAVCILAHRESEAAAVILSHLVRSSVTMELLWGPSASSLPRDDHAEAMRLARRAAPLLEIEVSEFMQLRRNK